MNAGVPSSVCTRLGESASLSSTAMAPCTFEVAGVHRFAIAGVGDDDVTESLLQIVEVLGEAKDRHHLRRHRDVEAGFARVAVGDAAERADDLAQRAIVHVHDAAPRHPAAVDAEFVAPIDVVVDNRR